MSYIEWASQFFLPNFGYLAAFKLVIVGVRGGGTCVCLSQLPAFCNPPLSSLYPVLLWIAPRHPSSDNFSSQRHVDWKSCPWSWCPQKDAFSKKFRIKCQASSQRCARASWKPSSSLCLIWASECSNMFMRVTHAGAAPELPSSIVPASGWLAWLPP